MAAQVALAVTVDPQHLWGVRQGISRAHCEVCQAHRGEPCVPSGGFHLVRVAAAFRDGYGGSEPVQAVLSTIAIFTTSSAGIP